MRARGGAVARPAATVAAQVCSHVGPDFSGGGRGAGVRYGEDIGWPGLLVIGMRRSVPQTASASEPAWPAHVLGARAASMH